MTAVWVAWELDYEIRHGELSIKLLHPLHPVHEYISFNLADKIMRFVIFTPMLVAAALLIPDISIVATSQNIALFAVAVVAAWFMRFLTQFLLGLAAFWFSQALVLTDVFWMLYLLFGGGIAPIELLPDGLRQVANVLPFRYMLAFPIEILTGRVDLGQTGSGLGIMLGWIAALYLAVRVAWARGIRRFGAFGA
jgi:ABC-2 type transport system permease protein